MSKTFRSALERRVNSIHLQPLKIKTMYCPKITYCFNDDDIRTLNERIKSIANNYNDDRTGWFEVDEQQHLTFVDEQDNMYTINLRGRFWKNDDPEFDLDFVTLEKDGVTFSFDVNIFDDHI